MSEVQLPSSSNPWPMRALTPLGLHVGPCAWRATMLLTEATRSYVLARPSLIVIEAEDGDDVLTAVAKDAGDLPLLLRLPEPTFVRRFESQVLERLDKLGRSVDILSLEVEDTAELKSGGLLQTLFSLREKGRLAQIGLSTPDILAAEWLSQHTAGRVLMLPYSLQAQAARYRVLPLTADMGQACIAHEVVSGDTDDWGYALGSCDKVLPMCDQPWPADVKAWTPDAVEASWQAYQKTHTPPPALPRSRPPE